MARRQSEAAFMSVHGIGVAGQNSDDKSSYKALTLKKSVMSPEICANAHCLQFSPDAKWLLVGLENGSVKGINVETGKVTKLLKPARQAGLPITCIRFFPKKEHLAYATSADCSIFQINVLAETCEEIAFEQKNQINSLDFSEHGNRFATGGSDASIRIYDPDSLQLLKTYTAYNPRSSADDNMHTQRIFSLKYVDDIVFMSGGWDNMVKIWDQRTEEGAVRHISGPHIAGDAIDFKNKMVLTGSWRASDALQIWDFNECKLLKTIPFDSGRGGEYIYSAHFTDRKAVIAGGSGTGSMKAINYKKDKLIGEISLGGIVNVLDCIRGGHYIAFAGASPYVKLAQLS